MGEEKEKKKKKKKKEVKEATPPPVVEEKKPEKKKKKKSTKKKRSTGPKYSGPLTIFNETQIREFKDGFNYMDSDKDGIISKQDLFAAYDKLGVRADDQAIDEMVNEAPNPITFTQMLTLFALNMGGKVDDDELVKDSFKAFDEGDGSINPVTFEGIMTGKGDRLTAKEVKEIFPELPRCKDNPAHFSIEATIQMLIAKGKDKPPEPEPEPVVAEPEAAAEPEPEAEQEINFGDEEEAGW